MSERSLVGKTVLHAGFFNKNNPLAGGNVFKVGLLRNNVNRIPFDYRLIAKAIGVPKMNALLIKKAENTDILMLDKGELIISKTLKKIRAKGTKVIIRYGDMRPKPEEYLIKNLKECDVLFLSSAGKTLEHYFKKGKPKAAAFYFNPTVRGLPEEYKYFEENRSLYQPLFSGTVYTYSGNERDKVYKYLCAREDINIIGCPHFYIENKFIRRAYVKINPPYFVRGKKYFELIIGSKFGIGVNSFQNIKYYTSARLTHYLTFAKLFLAYRFPNCEDLFKDLKEIVFYDDIKDLHKKINYYLKHPAEAEAIGKNGQSRILKDYNAEKMVKMMLEITEKGDSNIYPWNEIYV
jgi:glycosyltransferase involved in cell wall biosynthesis